MECCGDCCEQLPADMPMECAGCGFQGQMSDFLRDDMEDTICPKCGEADNHVYEV